jgi:glycerol dehydrogenase-like iron-containing ADH family enzyme
MDSKRLFKVTLLADLIEKELTGQDIFNGIKDKGIIVDLITLGSCSKRFVKRIDKVVKEESAINFGDFYDHIDSLIDEEISKIL